ncbi:aldose epimerase family protein [Olsenella sp. An188]|uniref:aldose epimerase family protein n=1 Tax=Olsenella sp. An188 TaxID=1965579 RepID=UPI000B36CC75|nr:aldose epimerase family protein [Olsenella sp. An188]OUP38312.1 galactose-1-epimerase [Olsenella sp. An188]
MRGTPFGTLPGGGQASLFELRAGDVRALVSDFGATLVGVVVPDARGRLADVVLGYADAGGYAGENGACYGGTIGPVANRTDRAEVPLGGRVYHLPGNDGPGRANNLHTDLERGLHKRLWEVTRAGDGELALSLELADGELGLPGNRRFTASFSLGEKDGATELVVAYGCASDAPTYVNMTNHAYFNLSGHGSGTVDGTLVSVDADSYLPVRADSVSEGEVLPVDGTPFDFRAPKPLGADVEADDEQIRRARGYDHCLCVRGWSEGAPARHALRAEDPASGRALDVLITAPGAHLYTGNWLSDEGAKDGATYAPRSGFAFEPEFYPDCVHHDDWPQSVCAPGRPYASTIVYRFSRLGA